jgi:hypothetical protein
MSDHFNLRHGENTAYELSRIVSLLDYRSFESNPDYGNVKLNGYKSDLTGGINTQLSLGSFNPNTSKQIIFPTNDAGFEFVFSNPPTQTVPAPDREAPDLGNAFYNSTTGSFYENKILGQGHFFRLNFNVSKLTGASGALIFRLDNDLSSFHVIGTQYLPSGVSEIETSFLAYTIADQVSLPSVLGRGQGYIFRVQTGGGISVSDVTLENITRISLPINRTITL